VIRTHPDDPPLTAREAAEIARITGMAVIRRGQLTTAQERRIDRILDGARERAARQADRSR
jgi:hypothetical protein